MKTFGQQVLILGGFYFIISFLFSLGNSIVFNALNMIMFVAFIIFLVVLCCKKRYNFLISFQNRFRKISNYLLGLGIVQYFETIFVTIPGIIYGYKASQAQYNGLGITETPVKYLQITTYVYWFLLFSILILITYYNFRKNAERKIRH